MARSGPSMALRSQAASTPEGPVPAAMGERRCGVPAGILPFGR
jgi:hypothetical protein